MRHIAILLSFSFSFFIGPFQVLYAQAIQGKVIDGSTREPLAFAKISLGHGHRSCFTNRGGEFSAVLDHDTHFPVHLQISHLGYEDAEVHFDDLPSDPVVVSLREMPVHVEELMVEGNVLRRTAQSEILGSLINRLPRPEHTGGVFGAIAGFDLLKRGVHAVDPVFRLFRFEQLTMLYDGGVRVAHASPYRIGGMPSNIMPEELEKIELIRGPFSVRYGQTLGSIVNIVTEEPLGCEAHRMEGAVEAGYESNGEGRYVHGRVEMEGRGYDLLLTGGARGYGNYLDGGGERVRSAFSASDFGMKASFRLAAHQFVQAEVRQSFLNDALHSGLPGDTETGQTSLLSVDYVAHSLNPILYRLTVKAYASVSRHELDNSRRPEFTSFALESLTRASTAGVRAELTLTPSARWLIFTGLDYLRVGRHGDQTTIQHTDPEFGDPLTSPLVRTNPVWQDSRLTDAGLFAEARWFPTAALAASAGIRATAVTALPGLTSSTFEQHYGLHQRKTAVILGGHTTLTWEFREHWDVQLSLGRGVRTPSMEERYADHLPIGADGATYVGNPNLLPEVNHQAELSLEKEGGNLHLLATVFSAYLTNYIAAVEDPSLPPGSLPGAEGTVSRRYVNLRRVSQLGFEVSASWEVFDHWHLYGMVAHVEGENHDWHDHLPLTPPLTTTLGLRFDNHHWVANLRSVLVAAQKHYAHDFHEHPTASYETLDVSVEYRWSRYDIGAGIENVFDRLYTRHLNWTTYGIPDSGQLFERGRNLSIFARLKW